MDIDIDLKDRNQILSLLQNIPAAIKDSSGAFKKHNTGIYFHNIPINPLTDTASIDYREAEERGYFKIDLLNVGIYQGVRDEAHLVQLMNTEPVWELLLEKDFVDNLFHLRGHHEILKIMKPGSIEQLAMVLAMIRPAKRHLIGQCWDDIADEIWEPDLNGEYAFKKSHSFSYAAAVIVHMNLLCEQLNSLE